MFAGVDFTPSVRAALLEARSEASRLGHRVVDTEHLLFALLQGPASDLTAALAKAQQTPQTLLKLVEPYLRPAAGAPSSAPELPMTQSLKNTMARGIIQARERSHPEVGAGHILLALALAPDSAAGAVLGKAAVTPEILKEHLSS